ncbi:MAG: HEPN domain-containing protein [Candidatus Woesearchaeota archaeon]|nr:HEPN domain-containing protein [Candidatus Woesearchaeota archaeon]
MAAKSRRRLETAELNQDAEKLAYAAFLYQQATEKALKYIILKNGGKLPKMHDCTALAKLAQAPENVFTSTERISPYYFKTRYPDAGMDEISSEELTLLKKAAEEVLQWTRL